MVTVKTQAHCLLLGAAATTAFTWPWAQGSVLINGLHHVALAATIGGLADWWGVTAIFQRPLGIKAPGTDVIRNNYERLTEALAVFVSDDLLATANVMRALEQESFAKPLVEHFRSSEQLERLREVLQPLAEHALASLNTQQAEQLLAAELPKYIASLHIPELLIDILQRAVATDSLQGILQLVVEEGRQVLHKREFKTLLQGMAQLAEEEYNDNSLLRKFFVGGKSQELVPIFTRQLEQALESLANAQSELRCVIDSWLLSKLEGYRHDISFKDMLNKKLTELALDYAKAAKQLWLPQDADLLFDLLEQRFASLANSERAQRDLDVWLKQLLETLLEQNHAALRELVSAKLAAYDRDELIASMQERVGDDLQNIRKSGTYIGGLLGGLLFFIEFLAERLVG